MEPEALGGADVLTAEAFWRRLEGMALQSLQITAVVAMRARDVSKPSKEQQEAADRRPLRDEMPRRDSKRKG